MSLEQLDGWLQTIEPPPTIEALAVSAVACPGGTVAGAPPTIDQLMLIGGVFM